jgi:hypothetical protein
MCRSETLKLVCATFVAGAASAAYGEQIIDSQRDALAINVQISTATVGTMAAASDGCYWDNGASGSTPFGHASEVDTAIVESRVYDDFCVDACTCLKLDEVSADFLTTSFFGSWAGASACLEIYTDCDGCPDRLVASSYASNNGDDNHEPGPAPRKVTHTFTDFSLNNGWDQLLDEIVLDEGCYWLSIVHKGDGSWTDRGWWCTTDGREEYSIVAGEASTYSPDFANGECTPISETNTGKRDFAFCVMGEASGIICDNGNCSTMGSPSALDTSLPTSRTADNFYLRQSSVLSIIEVCLINNCDPHRSIVEVYDGDCYPMELLQTYGDPIVQHALDIAGNPLYSTAYDIYPGGDAIWQLTFCIENGLLLNGGQTYWVSPVGLGTGTFGERAFFAFNADCKSECLIKISEGQFFTHPLDYWMPVSYETQTPRDFAFKVYGNATDGQADGGDDTTSGDNGRGTLNDLRENLSAFGFNTINARQ